MGKDIAIIGMSARVPDATTIPQFYKNLKEGKDSVKEMPLDVMCERTIPLDKEYTAMGFLDDIDKFDHKFFNIPVTEAQHMEPVQKVLMEVAYETLESTGYSIDHFDNSRTVIYLSHADYSYIGMLVHRVKEEPTIFTGNNHFAAAGRIARFFNFRGNATVVNNGCSSALNAVHLACNEIIHGEADLAMAMGARIIIDCAEKNPAVFDVGIEAFDGKTRSFSADSNGSGEGEMIGCILLKPLDKAIADNDHIYAVIKSSVANQSGQLSSSLTATNSAAQAEMLREAWKRAGIDPLTVTHIEAHGSGTKLGDPIEISGIDMAFQDITDKKHFVAVSSVKTNIGHTDTGAGMAGIIKTALSVKHGELFPSLHFSSPNPFIDFKNSVTYVNTELKKWEPECGVRRAGVSSLGFTGNNVHVILENPPARKVSEDKTGKTLLFTVSAKTPGALKRNIGALMDYIKEPGSPSLIDTSYTLITGRKHYEYRCAVLAETREQLLAALEREQASALASPGKEPLKKLICVFSPDIKVSEPLISSLSSLYGIFKDQYEKCIAIAGVHNEAVQQFAFQYALYMLLADNGLSSKDLVGLGVGKQAVMVLTGKITLEEAISAVLSVVPEETGSLQKRLEAMVEKVTEKENVLFIEMGPEAGISGTLRTLGSCRELYEVLSLDIYSSNPVLSLLREVYLLNYRVDWNKFGQRNEGSRVVLPSYQFEKTRCWIKEPTNPSEIIANEQKMHPEAYDEPSVTEESVYSNHTFPAEWTDTERKVAEIWSSILKVAELRLHDDFFALGGHSLFLIQVNNKVEGLYGFKFEIKELFAFATIKALAQAIDMMCKRDLRSRDAGIPAVGEREYYPLSFAQKRLWILSQFAESSVAYNLPQAHLFEGRLNKRAFSRAIDTVIARHEILRTVFVAIDGEPVQKILSPGQLNFSIQEIDISGVMDSEEEAMRLATEEAISPFDLQKGPMLRTKLIRLGEDRLVLLFNMHHIIGDGWSSNILVSEVLTLYHAYSTGLPGSLMPLRIQYKDYAEWQAKKLSGEELLNHRDYWHTQFSGQLPALNLLPDKPRPAVQTFNGDMVSFTIDKPAAEKIGELSRESGVTLFMTLLSALNTLFYRYSGQTDIIIGTPTAGRDHSDLENQIGFYINTLALRSRFRPEDTFSDLLQTVKDITISSYEHQIYPLDRLIDELNLERDMSRSALFDVIMILHNTATEENDVKELAGLRVKPFEKQHKVSQRDLTFNFTESEDGILSSIEYNTDIYSKEWVSRLVSHFLEILNELTARPFARLIDLKTLSPAEKQQLVNNARLPEAGIPEPKVSEKAYVAPRNEIEKQVVDIIEKVLGRSRVSVTDNFFEIGGHSLKAMRLIYKLNKDLHTKIGLATIYEHPTIEELVHEIINKRFSAGASAEKEADSTPGLKPLPVQEHYDVTYAQLNFLTPNQLVEDDIMGRLPLENLDEKAFFRTWDALVERHESFRTVFVNVNGTWKQRILDVNDPMFRLELIDLRHDPLKEDIFQMLLLEVQTHRYDLQSAPLLRAKLIRLSESSYELIFTFSHAIGDGWTVAILEKDLRALYAAFLENRENPLKPLPVQVKEYAAWHREYLAQKGARHREYWHEKLKGKLKRMQLPADRPEIQETGDYMVYRVFLDSVTREQLNVLASKQGVSLYAVMMTAMNILLYRLTGEKDILLNTPVATRDHEELQGTVGFLVSTLLISSRVDENRSFADYLKEISNTFVEAMSHSLYPLEMLFEELQFGVKDVTPVLLNTHNYPGQELVELLDPTCGHERLYLRLRVQLGFVFDEYTNGIEGSWVYRSNMFNPQTIEQIASRFSSILQEALADSSAEINKMGYAFPELDEVN